MKFKTFRALLIGGVIVVAGGAGYALFGGRDAGKVGSPPVTDVREGPPPVAPTPPTAQSIPAAPTAPVQVQGGLRPLDVDILARVKQGISGERVKEAFPGKPVKVSLYKDAGFSSVNRVKIDLDRDDKWDEKWTLSGDSVKRQVSPTDDDKTYSLEYTLAGDRWKAPGGQAAAPPSPPEAPPVAVPAGGQPLRPMDEEILARVTQGIAGDRVKDATAGKPYKVSLYRDAGQARVNRAKVDLDRDEKWDEKWTFEGTEVKRQVAPADDEVYATEYRLRAGAWVKK